MVLKKIRDVKGKLFGGVNLPTPVEGVEDEEFIELSAQPGDKGTAKILLKYFQLEEFSDIKPIIDSLRGGFTICLIKMKSLQDKDEIELRRAISKLKKTCQALGSDLVGIEENWIVAAPSYVEILKGEKDTEEMGNE